VEGVGQQSMLGLAYQQIHMLGHDDVSVNPQGEAAARVFQNPDE
jgi:hypothetical protein